jgi:hypothetical protein
MRMYENKVLRLRRILEKGSDRMEKVAQRRAS